MNDRPIPLHPGPLHGIAHRESDPYPQPQPYRQRVAAGRHVLNTPSLPLGQRTLNTSESIDNIRNNNDNSNNTTRNVYRKLARRLTLPALPTGSESIRFLRSARAANVPLVAVTGGLSFVGSHIVRVLLARGNFVRTLVPQGANSDFLRQLPGASTRLQIVELRDPCAEDARPALLTAFRGATVVVHAASFSTHGGTLSSGAAARRVVDALKIALDAAAKPGNVVCNFIYLSSACTVFDPSYSSSTTTNYTPVEDEDEDNDNNNDNNNYPVLTELDWFNCSPRSPLTFAHSNNASRNPVAYAYTVAELRLWARVGRSGLPFNVVSVIPAPLVLGPVLSARHATHTPSLAFIHAAASAALRSVPDFPAPCVDVRDVARAVAVLVDNHNVAGRVLLSADSTPLTASALINRARHLFPYLNWPLVYTARVALSKSPARVSGSMFQHLLCRGRCRRSSRSKIDANAYDDFVGVPSDPDVSPARNPLRPTARARRSTDRSTSRARRRSRSRSRGRFTSAIRGDPEAVKMFKLADFAAPDRRGCAYSFSQKRARQELGIRFRSLNESLSDTVESLHRLGILEDSSMSSIADTFHKSPIEIDSRRHNLPVNNNIIM